jgi:hypothetical protein
MKIKIFISKVWFFLRIVYRWDITGTARMSPGLSWEVAGILKDEEKGDEP